MTDRLDIALAVDEDGAALVGELARAAGVIELAQMVAGRDWSAGAVAQSSYRDGQLAEQRHLTGDSVLDAVTRDALGHGVVYAPGAYRYDLAVVFPAASAGLDGPWPCEGLVEAAGRTYLTESATAGQVRARLLALLAGPGLADREVTVVRCTLTPESAVGGAR